ncbi:S-type pyocin domain-containing protein [Pseudomonas sp. NPDC099000]|uniref:S-type pyocin domain-containing protein n=1 Tax=Pseudomonas sp. NPDC099000 TaxID=3364488 RepID=UPI00383A4C6B
MELKATLKDYTEPEFQALVNRIWAVDLPKVDHDRLINHFDRIVGHPKGADLLFYPAEDDYNGHTTGSVVYYVEDWHHKRGQPAFKGEGIPMPSSNAHWPSTPMTFAQVTQLRIAQSLAAAQKVFVDVATSQNDVEPALSLLERRIKHLRSQQSAEVDIRGREADIRSLEIAEFDTRLVVRRYEFWEMRLKFKRDAAQRDLTYGRAEQAQWQNIAQLITATESSYLATLSVVRQRLNHLQIEAETLLINAQTQLVRQRYLGGVGPVQTPGLLLASLGHVNSRPGVWIDGALSQPMETYRVALQKSVRSAVAEFTWQITSGTEAHQGQYAAVLRMEFSSRAEVGRYAVCVPLHEFQPIEGHDWHDLAANTADVDIAFRMISGTYDVPAGTMSQGVRLISTLLQVAITPTNGNTLSSKVRVRPAVWKDSMQAYCFTADGAAPVTVSWRAPAALETTPDQGATTEYRLGFLQSPPVPLLEPFDGRTEIKFDDYIVVFPTGSGVDPLYVMFRDRREFPLPETIN